MIVYEYDLTYSQRFPWSFYSVGMNISFDKNNHSIHCTALHCNDILLQIKNHQVLLDYFSSIPIIILDERRSIEENNHGEEEQCYALQ